MSIYPLFAPGCFFVFVRRAYFAYACLLSLYFSKALEDRFISSTGTRPVGFDLRL